MTEIMEQKTSEMNDQNSNYIKMSALGFHDAAFLAKSITEIDFDNIKNQFEPKDKRFPSSSINKYRFFLNRN